MREWPRVSVVFVTYSRMTTLRPTFDNFLVNTDYPRDKLQLIAADDGSPEGVLRDIRAMPFDVYCFGKTRGDLGANQNRGIAAAHGEYILQLQDDFVCHGPCDYLSRAVTVMESAPEVGMLMFNHHPIAPVREVRQIQGNKVLVYVNGYSDWPHLKSRPFIEAIGPYKEGVKMWDCECDYMRRVNEQARYVVAHIAQPNVFEHIGAELSFNTGNLNSRLGGQLQKLPFGYALVRGGRTLRNLLRR